jgi:hypothetical protein
MIDETLSRRRSFHEGIAIRLANQQAWSFLAPSESPDFMTAPEREEYLGLLRVYNDAEDRHERALSELALGIFLIGLNYELAPEELECLFTFPAGSEELADFQQSLRSLAHDHAEAHWSPALATPPQLPRTRGPKVPFLHLAARQLARLRSLLTDRKWLASRSKGEAPL